MPERAPPASRPGARPPGSAIRKCATFCWVSSPPGLAPNVPLIAPVDDGRGAQQSEEGGEMATRKTVGAVVAGLGLVLSSVLASGTVAVARGADPSAPRQAVAPWAGHLAKMDAALATGDI